MSKSYRFFALAALTATGAACPALAQVTRCTDPVSQKVTYTDALCAAGEKHTVMARKLTFSETVDQERQAAVARQRLYREAMQLRRTEVIAARQGPTIIGIGGINPNTAAGSGNPRLFDKSKTPDCIKARRALAIEESKVTQTPRYVAALADMETECGIDGSKYMPKPDIIIVNPAPPMQDDSIPFWDDRGRSCTRIGGFLDCR